VFLTLPRQQAEGGCTRSWEGTEQGQLTPADQRDIPDQVMCSAIKTGRKKELWCLSSQVTVTCDEVTVPAFLETAERLPARGKQ